MFHRFYQGVAEISLMLLCNYIGTGLTVKNSMNRTTTTGNGNIKDGRRGGGGGAPLSSSRG